ncbi:MAG: bifunctional phosphoribosylaminoimidazolecarboxamide formyltransferase/IMP cyclohydrolase [Xylanivirga thermophila]|jgi:phosphoribosylaminoimidazolecarboxamide formyltransferase / IMP cyclohydrolase|uniref:bifunctional phosphoribosylaminoimidazolecarboxamide formyltransferase/IMP cyclohydrolase n=1 Tax=Xylanivirga thermophila TaxID=2496273 RepID=UPI00101D44CC|nr:bifunctional phosphoribosylaminoimidazolecarboxamide formyltransferase/IMP cyclohydrolase [Xylanivirga thermophila]
MKRRAIISVSDKTGIVEFARRLSSFDVEIVSTGGTAKVLQEAGVSVTNVSDITGFPECLDGRVKTLHPNIHAGILAMRQNSEHMKQLGELDITPVDFVIINLYPFKETILKDGVKLEEAIENIDIGGPSMLRAAAKNYQDVTVLIDPNDYEKVLDELEENGEVKRETKFYLAAKVFEHTAHYDALIANYLSKQVNDEEFPELLTLTYEKVQTMRYGENPHQKGVFYKEVGNIPASLINAKQLHGKALSYNNINDTNGAIEALKEFDEPTVVAVKHANPCGVGTASTIYDAYKKAYDGDPISIFGGIIVANREIDAETAAEINKIFVEIVVAPSYTEEALDILFKKKNIRVLELGDINTKTPKGTWDMKKVYGGLLVQDFDTELLPAMEDLEVVTDKKPTDREMEDLIFAWKVVKHTKSNAIVIAKDNATLGVGPGQTNRIWAAEQAIDRSGDKVKGAVMASDAFFPFPDCVEAAAKAGITAIIQPGGSIRDDQSIEACNKYGIAMIFTGMRHFKH